MKPFILASVLALQMQTAIADVPLSTPPKPIPMEAVDAYSPKSPAAKHLWRDLSITGRQEVYQVEHAYYFNPADKETNYEIIAIAAYDTLIRQKNMDSDVDEHSYVTGFLDCKTALDSKDEPKKVSSTPWWKTAAHVVGALGYAAGTPAGFYYPTPPMPTSAPLMPLPTYIQRVSAPNSSAPTYQISNF